MDMAIQKVQEEMKEERRIIMTTDKEKLRAYQMRMMSLSDQVSGLNFARREGIMEGEKKGRFERDYELVKKQIAKGKSIEEIADFMDMSVEQVQKILQENGFS
jgi:predicted transposase/invertase (TIGR01784 family)